MKLGKAFCAFVVALSMMMSVAFSSPSMASPDDKKPAKHSAAWNKKHRKHSAAWYRKHRKHSAAWYKKHRKHSAAWYKKHGKEGSEKK